MDFEAEDAIYTLDLIEKYLNNQDLSNREVLDIIWSKIDDHNERVEFVQRKKRLMAATVKR